MYKFTFQWEKDAKFELIVYSPRHNLKNPMENNLFYIQILILQNYFYILVKF